MFKKRKKISELNVGDSVDDVFVVKIKREFKAYKNGYSFYLILSDSSGRSIDFVYWGGTDEVEVRRLYSMISGGEILHISGRVGSFRSSLQVSADEHSIFTVLEEGEYDPTDFVMPPRRDPEKMFSELMEAVNGVKNPHIKKLLLSIYGDANIAAKVKRHPAGIEIHHNRWGGLLDHSLEVLEYCKLSAGFFDLNEDLLVAGSLLHDIGKLEEMELKVRIKATRSGQLLGHIVQGAVFLSQKMEELGTPKEIKEKIIHIVVSHHGQKEYGSPKEPMFPEALTVHLADLMSSKLSEMQTFVEMVKASTHDEFAYHKRGRKNILIK